MVQFRRGAAAPCEVSHRRGPRFIRLRLFEFGSIRSCTRNGVLGVKLHRFQFIQLVERRPHIRRISRSLRPAEAIARLFSGAQYIWLRHRDKVRQAISFLIACQTDQWWSLDERSQARRTKLANLDFKPDQIARMAQVFEESDEQWQHFAGLSVGPLLVEYEDWPRTVRHSSKSARSTPGACRDLHSDLARKA